MIKRLSACIREYRLQTILTPLFMVGEVACECIIPLITSNLVNGIQNGCGMAQIVQYGVQLFLMALLSLACGVASGWFCATASAGFAKNLRHDLYYKVQDYSFANIDRFSASSLVTRLTTDVSNVQNAYMMLIRTAVRAPLMLIFAVIMSIRVGKQLAFVFAAVIPILGFGLAMMVRTAMPLFRAVFKKYDRLNNSVQENVQAMRVVKSFVREEHEKEKFKTVSNSILCPSWIYCPSECRSVEKMTESGKIPLLSLPSLSPKSCFHHSFSIKRNGSYPTMISTFFPFLERALRKIAY